MKSNKYNFNLIEIVLTVAVVAFGVVIILGMLPKGLTATRNVAAVSYASSVIDQIGGALQQHGADSIGTSFNNNAVNTNNEKTIMKDYPSLVMYIDNVQAMPSSLKDKYKPFSTGVFKCTSTDLKDVYLVVMGNSYTSWYCDDCELFIQRDLVEPKCPKCNGDVNDGERLNNIDFSGMIRVCKEESPKGSIIKLEHSSADENHTCLDTAGDLQCDLRSSEHGYKHAVVYVELSFPLSRPYEERQKMYYSFDAKK